MSSTGFTEQAREWGKVLEERERAKTGLPLRKVRPRIAARIGAAPGTLENLSNGRLKNIAAHFYDRLRRLVIEELQAEVKAHEHEIAVLMAIGADPGSGEMDEAKASLRAIKAILTREARHG